MGKYNCCVPNCTNNWRNSPGLKFHALPGDPKVPREYKRLIRNDNLRVSSTSTKNCCKHFPGGERCSRTQLPSIFTWSKAIHKRREIVKNEVPKKSNTPGSSTSTVIESTVTSINMDDQHIFEERKCLPHIFVLVEDTLRLSFLIS
ncbi:THAP domain-containing protein 11-like, partial [Actinia tenebrosa]|uniref:THAP domain-containing protein 11-like n=1 Tax=Actinia tenebrosa TaxID=6105 RepID=A0A6P8H5P0_ACTTE